MIYYFTVAHIAEDEEVTFSIDAETFGEALELAQLINPTAKFNGETKESPPKTTYEDDHGVPF